MTVALHLERVTATGVDESEVRAALALVPRLLQADAREHSFAPARRTCLQATARGTRARDLAQAIVDAILRGLA